jgi:hypothetical protein
MYIESSMKLSSKVCGLLQSADVEYSAGLDA